MSGQQTAQRARLQGKSESTVTSWTSTLTTTEETRESCKATLRERRFRRRHVTYTMQELSVAQQQTYVPLFFTVEALRCRSALEYDERSEFRSKITKQTEY